MRNEVVVEWAPFELVEDADEAELLEASEALQAEFLSKQKGFIRRELLKGGDNRWVDLVYWSNRKAAEQAVKNAADSDACFRYFQLMVNTDSQNAGAGVMHFTRKKSYEKSSERPSPAPAGRGTLRGWGRAMY